MSIPSDAVFEPARLPEQWEELPAWYQDLWGHATDGTTAEQEYVESTYMLRECCGMEYLDGGPYYTAPCPSKMCLVIYCPCGDTDMSTGPIDCPTCGSDYSPEELDRLYGPLEGK